MSFLLFRPLFFSRGFRFCQFLEVVDSTCINLEIHPSQLLTERGMTCCFCWIIADSRNFIHMLFAFLVTLITLLHVKKQPNTANEKNDLTMESRRSNPKLPNGIKNYGTSGLEGTFFKNPKNMVSFKKKKRFSNPTHWIWLLWMFIRSWPQIWKVMNPLYGGVLSFHGAEVPNIPRYGCFYWGTQFSKNSMCGWSLSFCWWTPLKNKKKKDNVH